MHIITMGELVAIKEALVSAQEELRHVEEETDHVVTTGAVDLCEEALEIVEALLEHE